MMFLSTLASILLLWVSINVAESDTTGYDNNNNNNTVCTVPFYLVGDECLLIDRDIRGTWSQMRDFCLTNGGDLVSLSDANLLYDINNHILNHGMGDSHFWVGANDRDTEGKWIWSGDSTPVRMTSPIWGMLNAHQPDGGIYENCGALSKNEFFFLHDDECDTSMYGLICQAYKQNGALKSTDTMPKNECPPPFERIGSGCFQVHLEFEYSWYEARDNCSGLYSHLAKLDDANVITDIAEYLSGANAHLWIDGTDEENEDVWLRTDSSQVKRGTPFWNVNNEGQIQEPSLDINWNCMETFSGFLYHFHVLPCSAERGALCQYEM